MLPERLKLECIDEGVRDVVIALNRIPGVNTYTTCEGHIWREIPAWPTKDGWVHFDRPRDRHEKLVGDISRFCEGIEFFDIEVPKVVENFPLIHTVNGKYEPHHDNDFNDLFSEMNKRERGAYFERAEVRREEILKGWGELNEVIIDYIRRNITIDVESLPFR